MHDVELDISFSHPWSLDTIRQAGQEDGYAALKREGKKMEKYGHEVLLCGSKPDLIPLVFEHFGHWGKSAELFLQKLAEKSKSVGDAKSAAKFTTDWRRRLSVLFQNCNSKVILKKIAHHFSRTFKFRDRSVQFTIH